MTGGTDGGSRRWSSEALQVTAILVDAVLTFGSAVAAVLLHRNAVPTGADDLVVSMGVIAAVLFVGFMAVRGGYRVVHLSEVRSQIVWVTQAWLFVFFVLGWMAFLLRLTEVFGRGAVTMWFVLGGLVLVTVHGFGAKALAHAYVRGTLFLRRVAVVVIAEESGARRIVDRLSRRGVGVASLSVVTPKSNEIAEAAAEPATRVATTQATTTQVATTGGGSIADGIGRVLARERLDAIFLFASWGERRRIEELKAELASVPLAIHLFADHEIDRMLRRPLVVVGDLIGLELERAPLDRLDRAMKRALDILVAGIGVVLLSPLMLLTAVAIVAESGFPVFFCQQRKGFGARPFGILKFRSMTVAENGDKVVQASRGDARVTRIGRMIRRTSIDELPQLFNVLAGDMSIVGPRPHAIAHDDYYDGEIASYALRQHVKPGITGWAQVNGLRGETREVDQMRARVEHDLWYIDNWSLWLDIRIIMATALKVFFDDNAF